MSKQEDILLPEVREQVRKMQEIPMPRIPTPRKPVNAYALAALVLAALACVALWMQNIEGRGGFEAVALSVFGAAAWIKSGQRGSEDNR